MTGGIVHALRLAPLFRHIVLSLLDAGWDRAEVAAGPLLTFVAIAERHVGPRTFRCKWAMTSATLLYPDMDLGEHAVWQAERAWERRAEL